MHGRHLAERRLGQVDVERLALVDVGAAVSRHVDEIFLWYLPHCAVEALEVVGYRVDILHGAVLRNDLVLELVAPQAAIGQVLEQVLIDNLEVAAEHAPRVDVARVGLERLVVAEYLSRRGGRHGREQQAVAQTPLGDLGTQRRPVPARRLGLHVPHVELEDALAGWRAGIGLVGAVLLGERAALGESAVVDGLEDVHVELLGLFAVEGEAHEYEGVGHALDADADGTVAHVGALGLFKRIVVDVDDAIEVARDDARHLEQLVEVKGAIVAHVPVERQRGQIAHGDLVLARVLDDLRAQVGALDGAEVLLVALGVGRVLVEHVGRAGLDLRLDDGGPELLGLDGLATASLRLVLFVQVLELLAPRVRQARALVRAHESPVLVALHAAHEQVGYPEGVEELACAHLLLARVLLCAEEVEHVRVPRLQVDGERARTLVAALVDVARRVVEHAQHRNQAIARAVCLKSQINDTFIL